MAQRNSRHFETAELMDDALLALLQEKDLEFITVKDICARAGVSRSTFYLHYETIADLLQETSELLVARLLRHYERDAHASVFDAIQTGRTEDLQLVTPEYLIPFLEFILEHKEAFSAVIKNVGTLRLDAAHAELERHVIAPILDRLSVPRKDRPYLMAFYLKGLVAILEEWIRGGCADSMEHVAAIMQRCCEPAQSMPPTPSASRRTESSCKQH